MSLVDRSRINVDVEDTALALVSLAGAGATGLNFGVHVGVVTTLLCLGFVVSGGR